MIPALIFSRDRACQLDALLRSLDKYAPGVFGPRVVLFRATTPEFAKGYERCESHHRPATLFTLEYGFAEQVMTMVEGLYDAHPHELVVTFTDDDTLVRPVDETTIRLAMQDAEILAFSLRLGRNTIHCYPTDTPQTAPAFEDRDDYLSWPWRVADGDFGYPMSLDGHVFAVQDLVRALCACSSFPNPNTLEAELSRVALKSRGTDGSTLACYPHSALVGVPLNRVQSVYPNRCGGERRLTPEALNEAYLGGQILEYLSVPVVGAHQELPVMMEDV
jgi:hypothetical protein